MAPRRKLQDRRMLRKALKRIGLLTLLVGATLALAGCNWATTHFWADGEKNLTIKQLIGARMIYHCTVTLRHGDGADRALCVLDHVEDFCRNYPRPGVTEGECGDAASYGRWENIERIIGHVINSGLKDCMSFRIVPWDGNLNSWQVFPPGFGSCN